MSTIRVLVLRTAGTNCDQETAFAFEKSGAAVDVLHVNVLKQSPAKIKEYQVLALPGGFSYGDDVAAGKVHANELKYRIGETLGEFVQADRLVIGICNGFQVMVKMGLLPGPFSLTSPQKVTLAQNDSNKFEDRWVSLKVASRRCLFTRDMDFLEAPVAHGEGKFVAESDGLVDELEANGQVVLQYVGPDRQPAGYPWNPNGSQRHIAGICDATGRILGMMPHPERHFLPTQHPRWTRAGLKPEGGGAALFRNAVTYFR